MTSANEFPILLNTAERKGYPACPRTIPWEFIQPHEDMAQWNHQQTLHRLAQRGGLDPTEVVAIVEGRRWHEMDLGEAIKQMVEMVEKWQRNQAQPQEAR